jgi:hypothetical protein
MSIAPDGNTAGDPARRRARLRLAFWVWMLGIVSIVGGAALTRDSTAVGAIVGSLGVVFCVIGRFMRVAAEQPSP